MTETRGIERAHFPRLIALNPPKEKNAKSGSPMPANAGAELDKQLALRQVELQTAAWQILLQDCECRLNGINSTN